MHRFMRARNSPEKLPAGRLHRLDVQRLGATHRPLVLRALRHERQVARGGVGAQRVVVERTHQRRRERRRVAGVEQQAVLAVVDPLAH